MKAAVLETVNHLHLREVPIPQPEPGEVLLKVEATTLCGTDLRILSGAKTAGVRYGVAMGHEFSGRVHALGSGAPDYLREGMQVGCAPVVACLRCDICQKGLEHLCPHSQLFGVAMNGGMEEYVLIPAAPAANGNLVPVTHEIDPCELALAEPLSCCIAGARKFAVRPGETVVVLGTGPIGLIHIALARMSGATTVIASGRAARLAPATHMGATHVTEKTGDELIAYVREVTGGRMADVVVVAVGVPELAGHALQLAAPQGRVSYFAGFSKGTSATIDPNLIHYSEITVTGASNASRADYAQAVHLLESRALDLSSLITHRYPLEQFEEAFEAQRSRAGLKVALIP